MSFIPIPDAWELTTSGVYTDTLNAWAMTFGILDTEDHDGARAADIGLVVHDWWVAQMQPSMHNHSRLDLIRITDQESGSGVSLPYTTGLPLTGGASGDPAAGQAAMVVTLNTGARGRANRGRKYIPGQLAANQNAGDGTTWDSGIPADRAGRILALTTALNAMSPSCTLAVLSRSQALAIEVLFFLGRSKIGTQRRRVGS